MPNEPAPDYGLHNPYIQPLPRPEGAPRFDGSPKTMAEVHEALKKVDGDRVGAAMVLCWDRHQLDVFINLHPDLNTLWGNPGAWGNHALVKSFDPPTDISTLDRKQIDVETGTGGKLVADPLPPVETPQDHEAMAAALQVESHRVCRGLERLGLTDKEVSEAFGLSQFHGMHFKDSMGIIGGGMTRLSVKYQSVVNVLIDERLVEVRNGIKSAGTDTKAREPWVQEEALLYQSLVAIGGECRKIMDVANKGALTQAAIRSKFGTPRTAMKKAKPSFNRGEPIEA